MKKLLFVLFLISMISCVQPWFPFSHKIDGAGLLEPEKEEEETATVTIELDWPE